LRFAFIIAALSLIPAQLLPPTKGHAYGRKKEKAEKTEKAGAAGAAGKAGKADKVGTPAKAGAPDNAGTASNEDTSVKALFQNPRLVLLLCFLLLMFIFTSATNLFMGVYYSSEEGLNAGLGMYGLFFAICIGLETALMMLLNKFWQSMRIYRVLTLVCFAACSRSFILYLAPNVYVVQLCALSHALLCAPLWTCLSPYVNGIVSKELRATGQAAWSMMVFGLGPMIGSAIGGVVAESFGIRTLFLITGVCLFAVASVFYFIFKGQYKRQLAALGSAG
jgi:MFS family permease